MSLSFATQLHSQIFMYSVDCMKARDNFKAIILNNLRRSISLALSKEAALARKEARKWVRRCRVHLWKKRTSRGPWTMGSKPQNP